MTMKVHTPLRYLLKLVALCLLFLMAADFLLRFQPTGEVGWGMWVFWGIFAVVFAKLGSYDYWEGPY